jgi:hypothetical protein
MKLPKNIKHFKRKINFQTEEIKNLFIPSNLGYQPCAEEQTFKKQKRRTSTNNEPPHEKKKILYTSN